MRKAILGALLAAMIAGVGPAAAGVISGVIANPEKCQGVQVIQRRILEEENRIDPLVVKAAFDAKTGAFASPELKAGTYDLRILIEGGMVEGVDMRVSVPDGVEPGELGAEDSAAVDAEVTKPVARYMNVHRTIAVRGNTYRAAALVEQIRHEVAHARPKEEITWRVEIWRFENQTGAWARPRGSRGTGYVPLWRLRIPEDMPAEKFRNMIILFDPAIGGLDVADKQSVENMVITIPKPDAALGKTAGSVAKQVEEDREKNPDRFDK